MSGFYKQLVQKKIDVFVHLVFKLAKNYPKEEVFVTVSQLKRAALSIALNYVEGFARIKKGNQLHFLEISYGSLKETKYLLYFSYQENFITSEQYQQAIKGCNEIGAMLWTEIAAMTKALDQ